MKEIFPIGALFEVLSLELKEDLGPVAIVLERTYTGEIDNYKCFFSKGIVRDCVWLELKGLYRRIS